jgi:type IV secretion system protein TrbE
MSGHVVGGHRFTGSQSIAERSLEMARLDGSPMSEYIRWLCPLNDHVILNKDGSLMACLDFSGRDLDSTRPEDLNQVRSQLIYSLEQIQDLAPTLTWQVRRRVTTKYPLAQFTDPIGASLDANLREKFIRDVHYVNRHTLALCLPPSAAATRVMQAVERAQGQGFMKVAGLFLGGLVKTARGQDDFPYESMQDVQQALEHFEKALSTFMAGTAALRTRLLRGDQLGGFLQLASTPSSDLECRSSLALSNGGLTLLDEVIPQGIINNDWADAIEFEHNGRKTWACCYTLDLRKRQRLQIDMLDELMSAPFEFTLSHVFKGLPRSKATRVVGEALTYHSNRKYSIKSFLAAAFSHGDVSRLPTNEAREEDSDEARLLQAQVEAGREGVGYYYGVLMPQASSIEDLLEAQKRAEELMQGARLSPRLEGLHKFSSFCATIPGSAEEVARWIKITAENFVDLCPARTVADGSFINQYLTETSGVACHALVAFPTKAKTPFYYTGYVGAVGHEVIIGGTGTGKTSLATVLWSQFRKYPGARVLVFDKNYSCRPAIYLQGGSYIDLNPERQQGQDRKRMSPIAALMQDASLRHLSFLVRWIELLASMRGYSVSADDRKELERALKATAELGARQPSSLRLGTVVVRLDGTTELAKQLSMWVGDSANASYFDNEVDDINLDQLTGIEMGSILGNEELAAPFMSYAFYRVEVRLRDMGAREDAPVPTQIYIPEVWYFLRHKQFARELDEWLVTLRKLGARVTMDTQTPDKLVESEVFPAIRDNIPTVIFTPNPRAGTASLRRMYINELGLNEQDLKFIETGVPGQDYYIRTGEISRRISMRLPPEVVAMTRSDPKAQKALDHYITLGLPEGWQTRYLKEMVDD